MCISGVLPGAFFPVGLEPLAQPCRYFSCWCVGASRPTQCVVVDRLEPLAQQPFRMSFHVYSVAQLFGDSFEGEGWRPRYKCAPSVYQLLVGFLDLGWSLSPNRVVSLLVVRWSLSPDTLC